MEFEEQFQCSRLLESTDARVQLAFEPLSEIDINDVTS